jgi:signal transduction histidine kinase/ABC-type phosphate/phosphonate transport system substrate-binding protein
LFLRVAVLVDRGEARCRQEWEPVLACLGRFLPGCSFTLLPWSHEDFLAPEMSRKADLIIVPPILYATLEMEARVVGLTTLVTDRGKTGVPTPLHGAIICRAADARIRRVKDLYGKRFAALAPTGLGGWLAAAREMKAAGVDPFRGVASLAFLGSQEAVIRSVLNGTADAGACRADVISMQLKEGKLAPDALRVLPCPLPYVRADYPVTTRPYPDWAVASLPHLPAEMQGHLARALLSLPGEELRAGYPDLRGFARLDNYSDIHTLLRELQLRPYENYGKMTVEQAVRRYGAAGLGVVVVVVFVIVSLRWTVRARTRALKESQKQLERTAELLREGEKLARMGCWEYTPETGRMVWSGEMFLIYGLDPSSPPPDFGDLVQTRVHPEDAPALKGEFESALQGRRAFEREYRMVRPDGQVRVLFTRGVPVSDDGKKGLRCRGMTQDITERKQIEERLRIFMESVESASDAVGMFTPEGRFFYQNRMFGELFGQPGANAPEALYVDCEVGREVFRTIRDGTPWTGEVQMYARDRRVLTVLLRAYANCDKDGQVTALVVIHTDVTAQRKLEENLRQAAKMDAVGKLAGGVAHDFNNMLGAILGYTELAQERCGPEAPVHADLKHIEEAARRSADLTRQLLAFARKQAIAPRLLDLNETVEGMLKLLRRLIGEDIKLIWNPCPELVRVRMDPAQVDQILANLCVNARDAITAEGGLIVIDTAPVSLVTPPPGTHAELAPGDYVMLTIRDNGCGMNVETVSHVFEPFFTTKAPGAGTGLGLATVYGAVRQNQGAISVESEPGHGTTFRIYLPRVRAEGGAAAEEAGGGVRGASSVRETILVVEDEPMLLEMAGIMIRKLGYRVLTAGSAGEAIDLAAKHPEPIDLVITDVIMPGMNGRDLADRIQAIHRGVKRLYMSGYTANVIAHHGVLDAGVSFIQKPFAGKDLAAKIREALAGG